MKFHLDNNIVEGTPEELVKYQELLEEKEADLLRFGHEHQLTETEQRAKGNFKGLLGSLKVLDSYTTSTESSTDEAEEDKLIGYTFWYLDGGVLNHRNVLKTNLEGYFEDSKGRRYSHQAVSGFAKPLDREDAREEFEGAKHSGSLLKYYPALDVFIREH